MGDVVVLGTDSGRFAIGQRVGVPRLGQACGRCEFCRTAHENLCDAPQLTGYDRDGGYAEYAAADERFCFALPSRYDDLHARRLRQLNNIYVDIISSMTKVQLDSQRLRAAAGEAVGTLKVLGNQERLLLLCELSRGEKCVGELEEELEIHQPTLSQQLGVLRTQGVVETRREGKNIYYRVSDPNLLEIVKVLYRLYCKDA